TRQARFDQRIPVGHVRGSQTSAVPNGIEKTRQGERPFMVRSRRCVAAATVSELRQADADSACGSPKAGLSARPSQRQPRKESLMTALVVTAFARGCVAPWGMKRA